MLQDVYVCMSVVVIIINVIVGLMCIQVWEHIWYDDSVLNQSLLIWQTSSRESRGQSDA